MSGSTLLILIVAVLSNQVTSLHAAAAPVVKRSVLAESIISLLKAEGNRNTNFQSTVLNTLTRFQTELEEIRKQSTDFQKTELEEIRSQTTDLQKTLQSILNTLYCPSHFRYVGHSCYKVSTESVDWKTANEKCLQDNSHLVSIDNNDTDNSVLRFLIGHDSLKNDTIWAGGNGTGEDMGSILSSNLLTTDHIALLKEWFPGKTFDLLYRASRDGMSGSSFHQGCNNQGATLSIGKDFSSNTTFGGYASVSWGSRAGYKPDSNAFLFRLCGQVCTSAKYGQYMYQQYALYDHSSCGPIFGKGYDLYFFGGSYSYDNANGYFSSNGYCRSSSYHTYNSNLGCGSSVKWVDVEVWSVVDDPAFNRCLALNVGNRTLEYKSCTDKARYICEL